MSIRQSEFDTLEFTSSTEAKERELASTNSSNTSWIGSVGQELVGITKTEFKFRKIRGWFFHKKQQQNSNNNNTPTSSGRASNRRRRHTALQTLHFDSQLVGEHNDVCTLIEKKMRTFRPSLLLCQLRRCGVKRINFVMCVG